MLTVGPWRAAGLAVVCLVAPLSACSRKAPKPAAVTQSAPVSSAVLQPASTSASSAAPSSSSSAPAPAAISASPLTDGARHPLTGGVEPVGPVVAVKIDNTRPALPQSGLSQADVIYQEAVEGGLTRLCAIYSTQQPSLVGPVRSARETDVELLGQYGKIDFAFSGANAGVLRTVRNSALKDARWDAYPGAYQELAGRKAPYRLYVSLPNLLSRVPAALAKDVGFRFGDVSSAARTAQQVTVPWPSTTNVAKYDDVTQRWTVSLNGREQVTVDNVVVQFVKTNLSKYSDVAGNRSPLSRTIGSGAVKVFRDGKVVTGRWQRSALSAPTLMSDEAGASLRLRPGTTFVMLVPNSVNLTVR